MMHAWVLVLIAHMQGQYSFHWRPNTVQDLEGLFICMATGPNSLSLVCVESIICAFKFPTFEVC